MKLIKTRWAAVIMAALMAAACGQKPSTIRESSASRARDFSFDAPAEPTEEARGAEAARPQALPQVPGQRAQVRAGTTSNDDLKLRPRIALDPDGIDAHADRV